MVINILILIRQSFLWCLLPALSQNQMLQELRVWLLACTSSPSCFCLSSLVLCCYMPFTLGYLQHRCPPCYSLDWVLLQILWLYWAFHINFRSSRSSPGRSNLRHLGNHLPHRQLLLVRQKDFQELVDSLPPRCFWRIRWAYCLCFSSVRSSFYWLLLPCSDLLTHIAVSSSSEEHALQFLLLRQLGPELQPDPPDLGGAGISPASLIQS